MPFTADVISDIHANIWKMPDIQISSIFPGQGVSSPNLILAGDIGDPDEPHLHRVLSYVRPLYKRILYIPGNHEFYVREPNSKKTHQAVLNWFQRLDDQWDNFYFFYRRTEVFDGIRIIGATGWSTAPHDTDRARFVSAESRKDRDFLEYSIANSKEPALVVTHYPPTLRVLQPSYQNSPYRLDYAQDLEILCRPPVKAWICGHIHQSHTLKIPYESMMSGSGYVSILCNPYGYPTDTNKYGTTQKLTIA